MTSLDATQADERLVLTTPRSAVLLSLPIFLATAALGLWFIGQSTNFIDTAWSWLGVVFLLVGAAVSVVSLFRPTRLILTPEGFHLTGPFSPGLIPWGDIKAFTTYSEPEFLTSTVCRWAGFRSMRSGGFTKLRIPPNTWCPG